MLLAPSPVSGYTINPLRIGVGGLLEELAVQAVGNEADDDGHGGLASDGLDAFGQLVQHGGRSDFRDAGVKNGEALGSQSLEVNGTFRGDSGGSGGILRHGVYLFGGCKVKFRSFLGHITIQRACLQGGATNSELPILAASWLASLWATCLFCHR